MPTTGLAPHGGKECQHRVIPGTSVILGAARREGGQAVGTSQARQLLPSWGSPLEPTARLRGNALRLGASRVSALQAPGALQVA